MATQEAIERDYRRLEVLLNDADSFVLTFILYRDIKEQRENAEKLKNLLDLPITEVALKGDNLNPVYTFLDLPKEPRQAIFYTFLGSSLPEGKSDFDKLAGYVNIQREAFTDAPHAVVLWLREEQLVRLMRRAPDFWAWRSGVFDVRGELQPDTSPYRELEEVDAFERGELEEQVALYREILKGQLERDKPDLAYMARTRSRLINALYKLALYKEMSEEAQEVVKLAKILESEELTSTSLSNLALAYTSLGRYDEAEPLYRKAVSISEKIFGKEHSHYTAELNNLAGLLRNMERYEEAELLHREAMTIDAQIYGENHPEYAANLNSLAGIFELTGRYDKAEPLYRKALHIVAHTLGEKHPDYASKLNNLASLLERTGRYDEAEQLYREAMETDEQALGKGHPNYAKRLNNLANIFERIGRDTEAEQLYHQALAVYSNRYGEDHPTTRLIAENYRLLLQKLEPRPPNP